MVLSPTLTLMPPRRRNAKLPSSCCPYDLRVMRINGLNSVSPAEASRFRWMYAEQLGRCAMHRAASTHLPSPAQRQPQRSTVLTGRGDIRDRKCSVRACHESCPTQSIGLLLQVEDAHLERVA